MASRVSFSTATADLPSLPPNVADLTFNEFFVSPVGPLGLELTPKMRRLDGKKVRILGFMISQEEPAPGLFLLAPMPITLHEHEFGLADDLPPNVLHVRMPAENRDELVPATPGPMLLTGTLKLGNRQEADGRVSFAHLLLDKPTSTTLVTR